MIPWNAAVATLVFWVGLGYSLKGLTGLARVIVLRSGDLTTCVLPLALGAVGMIAAGVLFPTTGIGLPVVWPNMSIQHWITFGSVLFGVVQLLRSIAANSSFERKPMILNGIAALIVGGLALLLPRANTAPPGLFSGHIQLPTTAAIGLVLLSLVSVTAIAFSVKSATAKGIVAQVSKQIGLLVGCVVFGLPFLFLLVTSFKEDKDMSSPNGIVWIPRVTQTMPVMNPDNPYFESVYKGVKVQADLEKRNPDGSVTLRIEHPLFFGGYTFDAKPNEAREIPRDMEIVTGKLNGQDIEGVIFEKLPDGSRDIQITKPSSLKGQRHTFGPKETDVLRPVSLRWMNFVEALEYLPPEAEYGWTYLKNTLWLVVMNVLGTLVSCSLVAYAFARLRFPFRDTLFLVMMSTIMLPAVTTLMPQFLIFRQFGWINTLKPMWVTSWFAAAFSVFMLRQFFQQVPYELEDAAKIDGCSYLRSLWSVMLPQVKPALAVIAIMTFMGAWNNFMGPLVYSSSPETLPISYAVQLFNGERSGDPGLLMAFVTMSLVPVIALFAFAQKFFIEGVTLSGFGGR